MEIQAERRYSALDNFGSWSRSAGSFSFSGPFELPEGGPGIVGGDELGTILVLFSVLLVVASIAASDAVLGPAVNPWLLGFQEVDMIFFLYAQVGADAIRQENEWKLRCPERNSRHAERPCF